MHTRLATTAALAVALPVAAVLLLAGLAAAAGLLPLEPPAARGLLVGLGIGLAVAGLAAAVTGAVVARRLRRMTAAIEGLRDEAPRSPTRDLHPDEIGEMSLAVDDLAGRLERRIHRVQAERDRLDAVLESMTEGVAAVDPEGRVALVNAAFLGIVGFAGDPSPVGRTLLSVVRSDALDLAARRALAGEPVLFSESTLTTRPPRTVVITAAPVRAANRAVTSAVVVLRDVTERRRLQAVRQDFVANVSHELKTPIAAIRGYAETLLDGALADDPEAATDFVRTILEHAHRMTDLVADLLDLAALDAGAYQLQAAEIRVDEILDRARAGVAEKARRRGVRVEVSAAEDLPPVRCDARALGQVLVNLLDNAVKYGPAGGTVRVRAGTEPGRLVITVADAGPGIPVNLRDRIFERFYRVDPGRARAMGGTGLGLSIVRNLVRLMNGRVELTCPAEGGSVFTVSLPIRGRPGAGAGGAGAGPSGPSAPEPASPGGSPPHPS